MRDHLPEVEHRDVVGDLEDVDEVVADEDDRDSLLGETVHEAQHLLGLGDAERGRGFVEDDTRAFFKTARAIATVWR